MIEDIEIVGIKDAYYNNSLRYQTLRHYLYTSLLLGNIIVFETDNKSSFDTAYLKDGRFRKDRVHYLKRFGELGEDFIETNISSCGELRMDRTSLYLGVINYDRTIICKDREVFNKYLSVRELALM